MEPTVKRYEKNPILTRDDIPYPVETVEVAHAPLPLVRRKGQQRPIVATPRRPAVHKSFVTAAVVRFKGQDWTLLTLPPDTRETARR